MLKNTYPSFYVFGVHARESERDSQCRGTSHGVSHLLVPYASCPVMRNGLFAVLLPFFGQIVQEEIDQNGVDFRIRLKLQYLSAEEFNSPYTAA